VPRAETRRLTRVAARERTRLLGDLEACLGKQHFSALRDGHFRTTTLDEITALLTNKDLETLVGAMRRQSMKLFTDTLEIAMAMAEARSSPPQSPSPAVETAPAPPLPEERATP
jgi:hypothetical protein